MMTLRLGALAFTLSVFLSACSCGGTPPVEVLDPDFVTDPDAGTLEPIVAVAGPDAATCVGGSVTVGSPAVAGFQYAWSPTTGLSDATAAQPTATPTSTQIYSVTVTDPATGRTATDEVTVTIHALPVAVIEAAEGGAPATEVCTGENWQLSGSNSTSSGATIATFAWTFGSEASSSATPGFTVTSSTATEVSLTVTDSNGCAGSTTAGVSALPLPTVSAGTDRFLGLGSSLTLSGSASDGTTPYDFTWSSDLASCAGAPCIASPASASTSVSPDADANFLLTVTDAKGCTGTDAVLVDVVPALVADAGPDGAMCPAGSVAIGSPARSGITYSWSPTAGLDDATSAQPTASPSATQTYTLTITETATGLSATDSVVVTVHTVPVAVITAAAGGTAPSQVCSGSSWALSGTGSTATSATIATYAWTFGSETSTAATPSFTVTSSTATQVSLSVTDTNGCSASTTASVSALPLPVASAGGDRFLGLGSATTLTGAASSGTAPYAYAWSSDVASCAGAPCISSPATASTSASPEEDANFVLTVTDSAGCVDTDDVLVDVVPALVVDAGADQATCPGGTVVIGPTAESGLEYAWSPTTGLSDATVARPTVTPTADGTYTVTVTDPATGLVATDSVAVTVYTSPVAAIESASGGAADSQVCSGSSWALSGANSTATDATIASYAWTFGTESSTSATASFTVTSSSATEVSLTVTDSNGCTDSAAATVSALSLPVVSAGNDRFLAAGGATTLSGSASGGTSPYGFAWTTELASCADGSCISAPSSASTSASPDADATFALTATDANGCVGTDTVSVNVEPGLVVDAGADQATCAGGTVVIGPTAVTGLEYAWSPTTGLSDATAARPTVTPIANETYTVTVTDPATGFVATDTVVVTVNATPVAVIRDAAGGVPSAQVCNGSNWALSGADSTATDATIATYAWTFGAETSSSATPSFMVSDSSATEVSLTVTDSNGCTDSATATVSALPLPTASAGDDRYLAVGGATALSGSASSGTAPYGYLWRTDLASCADSSCISSPASASTSASPDADATFVLTVTDDNGCTATDAVFVNVEPVLVVDAGADQATCAGGTTVIGPTADPSLDYAWSPTTGLSDATVARPTVTPTANETYTLTVTDPVTGFVATDSVTVTVNENPVAVINDASGAAAEGEVCGGSTWALSAASSSATSPATIASYSWTFGVATATGETANFTVSAAETATVNVTDSNGCTATASASVLPLELPTVSAGADRIIGLGGFTTLDGSASGGQSPYAFAWTSDAACDEPTCLSDSAAAAPQVSPEVTTVFSFTVSDENGCMGTDDATVTVTDPLVANAGADVGLCAGDSIQIGAAATGAVPPYSYAWTSDVACAEPTCLSDASIASPVVSPAVTTTFTQSVTDSANSADSDAVTVSVSDSPGLAGSDVFLRKGESLQIGPTAVAGATYAWTCSRPVCALSDASAAGTTASPVQTTTYMLDAVNGACTKSSEFTATVLLEVVTAPANGALAHPRNAQLIAQFDEPIDPASLVGNVRLENATTGETVTPTFVYDAALRILRITPPTVGTAGWDNGGDFTLILGGGPTGILSNDPQPNRFRFDVTVDFTVGGSDTTAPALAFRSPPVNAVGVSTTTSVLGRFNESLRPSTVNTTTIGLTSPAPTPAITVTGTVSFDLASNTFTFVPSEALLPLRQYTVTIEGVMDLAGNAATITWNFTTGAGPDVLPPTVTSVTPANGAINVPSGSAITVTFSEEIHAATLGGFRVLRQSDSAQVQGTVSFDPTTRIATFVPAAPLAGSTTFRVEVSGVQDLSGNVMASTFTSTFTTRSTLFFDDFESGPAKWRFPAPANTQAVRWGLQTGVFTSAQTSLTDSPGAKYIANTDSFAEMASPLTVTGFTSIALQFALRVKTEKVDDTLIVQVRRDGGAWSSVTPGSSGNTAFAITNVTVPVSGATTMEFRFWFHSDDNRHLDGVWIDDVLVQGIQ